MRRFVRVTAARVCPHGCFTAGYCIFQISAYRDHLERAGHELEMLKSQHAAAVVAVEKAKSQTEKFETIKIEMVSSIDGFVRRAVHPSVFEIRFS